MTGRPFLHADRLLRVLGANQNENTEYNEVL